MRTVMLLLLCGLSAVEAAACSCYSPEMREKTGRETLDLAQIAVFGRITALQADGSGELVVSESFKGPPKGAVVPIGPIAPGTATCPPHAAVQDQEVLVIAFQTPVTVCEKYPQDHFLLPIFRAQPPR